MGKDVRGFSHEAVGHLETAAWPGNVRELRNAIERAVRSSGSRCKACAIAVSGPAVFTKTIALPANLAEADVESQIQIEANQYIPFPLDEVSLADLLRANSTPPSFKFAGMPVTVEKKS